MHVPFAPSGANQRNIFAAGANRHASRDMCITTSHQNSEFRFRRCENCGSVFGCLTFGFDFDEFRPDLRPCKPQVSQLELREQPSVDIQIKVYINTYTCG